MPRIRRRRVRLSFASVTDWRTAASKRGGWGAPLLRCGRVDRGGVRRRRTRSLRLGSRQTAKKKWVRPTWTIGRNCGLLYCFSKQIAISSAKYVNIRRGIYSLILQSENILKSRSQQMHNDKCFWLRNLKLLNYQKQLIGAISGILVFSTNWVEQRMSRVSFVMLLRMVAADSNVCSYSWKICSWTEENEHQRLCTNTQG